MGTFGERLQREREMRGITLEEIAEATKIGTRSLRALEEQDFDKLPGGIFNKGFVRAYSKYLGIDEDQAVADYQAAVNEAQSSGKLTRPEYAAPTVEERQEQTEPVRVPWGLLIVIALIVAVGFAARSYYAQHGWSKLRRQPTPSAKAVPSAQDPVAQQPAADQNLVPPAAGAVQKEPGAPGTTLKPAAVGADAQAPSRLSADRFAVKVRAKEDAWIEITADGKRVASELMKANSEKVIHAEKTVLLFTGNAGGIEVSRNDQILPPLGDSGATKRVTITRDGVQE